MKLTEYSAQVKQSKSRNAVTKQSRVVILGHSNFSIRLNLSDGVYVDIYMLVNSYHLYNVSFIYSDGIVHTDQDIFLVHNCLILLLRKLIVIIN